MWIFNRVRGYRLTQVSSNADTGCEKGKAYRSRWTLTGKNISRRYARGRVKAHSSLHKQDSL